MAAITDYTDLISVTQAGTYLRLDPDVVALPEVQAELTMFINAACKLVEQYSNYRLKPQEIVYYFDNGQLNVYDFPIKGVVAPTDADAYSVTPFDLYSVYCDMGSLEADNLPMILNVGYADTDEDINPLLITAVLESVRVWYYNAESDTQRGILSMSVKNMLDPIKRFIV